MMTGASRIAPNHAWGYGRRCAPTRSFWCLRLRSRCGRRAARASKASSVTPPPSRKARAGPIRAPGAAGCQGSNTDLPAGQETQPTLAAEQGRHSGGELQQADRPAEHQNAEVPAAKPQYRVGEDDLQRKRGSVNLAGEQAQA